MEDAVIVQRAGTQGKVPPARATPPRQEMEDGQWCGNVSDRMSGPRKLSGKVVASHLEASSVDRMAEEKDLHVRLSASVRRSR